MPSGNTHILLIKYLPEDQLNEDAKNMLDAGIYFFQVGAVAPDLPYASIADEDLVLTNQAELADKFHYEHTTQVPLYALRYVKSLQNTLSRHELNYLFAFFLGYISHVVADGVMHPFVLDKVGDYKTNADAHRELEMKLDTLLYHYFTLPTGEAQELNRVEMYEELKNFDDKRETLKVMQVFRNVIKAVYDENYNKHKILGWASGLHNLFEASEGKLPHIFRGINLINSYLSPLYEEIKDQADSILVLEKPNDPTQNRNFLKKERIHFINDCIPKFYSTFIPLVEKTYNYIFRNGPELMENDFFEIDLDTGRPIAQKNNLEITPSFWS